MRLLLLLLLSAAVSTGDDASDAEDLFGEFFRWQLRTSPEQASLLGYHGYDARLSDTSPGAAVKMEINCRSFRKRAEKLLESHQISPGQRRYLKVLGKQSRYCEEGMSFGGRYFAPINFMYGVQVAMPRLFKTPDVFRLESLGDFDNVLRRLAAIPEALRGVEETLRAGVRAGMVYSEGALSRVDRQFDAMQVARPEESPFYEPFRRMEEVEAAAEDKRNVTGEAARVIAEEVLPAFQKLNHFLQEEYSKHLRATHGVTSLPGGKEFYQKCLEHHTTLEGITAEEVHQIGLDAVEELKDGVMAAARRLGKGDLSFSEFLAHIRESREFQFKSKEEGLAFFNELIHNKINPKLKQVLPDRLLVDDVYMLDIVVPDGRSGTASYSPPSKDGSRNGTFYINLNDLSVFQKTVGTTLSLHEANPGHHFQRIHDENHDFPNFLNQRVSGPTATSPSRIPVFTAHIEGWGLYSEFLGREMGVFEDDYQLLGHYSYNLLRAARLVVDTGMHAMGWDRQRVVNYLLDNTAFSRAYIELQADRYSAWPGQATGYKMGERMIRELRRKKENEVGFDLKEFHADYLDCLGFLDDLEECIREREEERAAPGGAARRRKKNAGATAAAVSGVTLATTFVALVIVTRVFRGA